MSTRLASLAMDTNDIDCVYHRAYPEIIWGIFRVRSVARYHELILIFCIRKDEDMIDEAISSKAGKTSD